MILKFQQMEGLYSFFYTDMYLETIDNEAIDVADLSEFQKRQ